MQFWAKSERTVACLTDGLRRKKDEENMQQIYQMARRCIANWNLVYLEVGARRQERRVVQYAQWGWPKVIVDADDAVDT